MASSRVGRLDNATLDKLGLRFQKPAASPATGSVPCAFEATTTSVHMGEEEMAADVSFEATTVVLVWCSHLLLTPFVLSRDTRIALLALALLAGAGAALMATREVNLMLYTHYVPGTSALVVSRGVLRGDGSGPIVTASVVGPAIIFVIEVQT